MERKQTEIVSIGPFEYTVISINGKQVPDIRVREDKVSGKITFVLDINNHAIDIPKELSEAFILFVADAMAQGAGYPGFGTDDKFNKFNVNITALNGDDMSNLFDEDMENH